MRVRGVFALLFLAGGGLFHTWAWQSFVSLGRVRSAQEVPISAVRAGPARLHGRVRVGPAGLLRSFYFKADCVYFEYRHTEEYRNSKGESRTRTLDSRLGMVPFLLDDGRGQLLIDAQAASFVEVRRKETTHRGNQTWYEDRLDPDDEVWVYGEVVGDFEALESEEPLRLVPGPDGVLRLSSEGSGRLLGIDQLMLMLWGILAGMFSSVAAGLGLPCLYKWLHRPRQPVASQAP